MEPLLVIVINDGQDFEGNGVGLNDFRMVSEKCHWGWNMVLIYLAPHPHVSVPGDIALFMAGIASFRMLPIPGGAVA
jgi:hypothetical protein